MRSPVWVLTVLSMLAGCGGSGDDPVTCIDDDGDGYGVGSACLGPDCADDDDTIHPGAYDFLTDGIDQDCDGGDMCLVDADGDHVSLSATATVASTDLDCADFGEATFSMPTNDCNDEDPTTYPTADEIFGDGIDQSCDGEEVCLEDRDGDGARGPFGVVSSDLDCTDEGELPASAPLDCADTPDADSACGGMSGEMCSPLIATDGCTVANVDEDCDGTVDEDGDTYYGDADGDGVGSADHVVYACDPSAGLAASSGDCDDRDATAWQLAMRFPDSDADGYGAGDEAPVCEGDAVPVGYALTAGDCEPLDGTAHPNAGEIPSDGIDQDCVGGDLVPSDTNGIFVSLDGSDGDPGTQAAPVATIGQARALADAAGYAHLYIAEGAYTFVYSGARLGQSLHGGYDAMFTSRGGSDATSLNGTSGPILGATPVAIDNLTIDVASDESTATAVNVMEGTLTMRNVHLAADGLFATVGIQATMSSVYVDGCTFDIERGSASEGILAWGGRTVVRRSRFVVHSATSSGSSTFGVSVYPGAAETDNAPATLAVVGNVFDVGIEGGQSLVDGVHVNGTRTRVLVANNTFRLGPADTMWDQGSFAVRAWAFDFPVTVDFVNNIVVAVDGPDAGSAVYLESSGSEARVALEHNAVHLTGANDCPVFASGGCLDAEAIAACEFAECNASSANLYADPSFLNSALHLSPTSVCVDAGASPPYAAALFSQDIAGVTRPQEGAMDIGAYEVED